MKTYGGSGCIDTHFLDLGTSWGVSGQLYTPAPLHQEKMMFKCILYELGVTL
jgi:hypothetical protein